MTNKKSFLLFKDSLMVLDDLTDEQAGKLFKAIKAIQTDQELELDAITKIALSPFKNQFIRDNEDYQKIVEANKNNGKKGGRPKKSEQKPIKPKKPNGLNGNPKKPDTENDTGTGIDTVSDKNIKQTFLDHVELTRDEAQKLLDDFGREKLNICTEKLNSYIADPNSPKSARNYKSHYHVLIGWVNDWYNKQSPTQNNQAPSTPRKRKNITVLTK